MFNLKRAKKQREIGRNAMKPVGLLTDHLFLSPDDDTFVDSVVGSDISFLRI